MTNFQWKQCIERPENLQTAMICICLEKKNFLLLCVFETHHFAFPCSYLAIICPAENLKVPISEHIHGAIHEGI